MLNYWRVTTLKKTMDCNSFSNPLLSLIRGYHYYEKIHYLWLPLLLNTMDGHVLKELKSCRDRKRDISLGSNGENMCEPLGFDRT